MPFDAGVGAVDTAYRKIHGDASLGRRPGIDASNVDHRALDGLACMLRRGDSVMAAAARSATASG
jgi:hypothetical protein